MQKTLDIKLTSDEAEKIGAAIKEFHRTIQKLFKEMDKDQAEIEKLKAETRAMLAAMKPA